MIHLKNQNAEVSILPERGALITSIKLPDTQGKTHELLWTPQNLEETGSGWPGGGFPICFPFAGRVWNRGKIFHYGIAGNEYPMPLHGFAFAQKWSAIKNEPTKVTLTLTDTEQTRTIFPFEFFCELEIQINPKDLKISFKTTHLKSLLQNQLMPVALGFHPYFRTDDASQLMIEAKNIFAVTPEGGAGKPSVYDQKQLSGLDSLAKSLIFADLRRQEVRLKNKNNEISLSFGPQSVFKHFVIWQNRQDPFWCLEPWMSLPDAVNINQGVQWLKPSESLACDLKLNLI